jgi:hypothetical protein
MQHRQHLNERKDDGAEEMEKKVKTIAAKTCPPRKQEENGEVKYTIEEKKKPCKSTGNSGMGREKGSH